MPNKETPKKKKEDTKKEAPKKKAPSKKAAKKVPVKKAGKKKHLLKKPVSKKKPGRAAGNDELLIGAINKKEGLRAELAETAVQVSYTLTITSQVALASLIIGGKKIDLDGDQDTSDPLKFSRADTKPYDCIKQNDGLRIIMNATGKTGDSWALIVTVDGSPLSDNPVKEKTDGNGRLNHDAKHN